jgi:transketolase
LDRDGLAPASGVQYGGYILWEASASPAEVILIGTGSEVHIALEAGKRLQEKGIMARVVSLPSWELFDAQSAEYRDRVLPPGIKRVSMEAGSPLGWERYVGLDGVAIGLSRFGASAPGQIVYEHLGLTAQHMADEALRLVKGGKK